MAGEIGRRGFPFRCLGSAPQVGGEPISPSHGSLSPAFAGFRSQSAAGEGPTSIFTPALQPVQPPQSWTMPAGIQRNFAECRPLECAASNKDHVSRIGHSHAAILLAQDFVRFHLRVPPCPEGRITRKTRKPNRLGGCVGKGMVWGYQPFFEEEHVPAQPTNNNHRPAPRRKRPATRNQNKPG